MLPPLRERGNDIAILAKNFVDAFCKENKINRKAISPEAQQKLISYPFPGNVRELKSIMELAVVMSDGENILPEHITLNSSTSINDLLNRETTLKEFESQIIQHYLDKYNKDVFLVATEIRYRQEYDLPDDTEWRTEEQVMRCLRVVEIKGIMQIPVTDKNTVWKNHPGCRRC